MSSGQSLRNGNSVEPGLPNTFRMPNARNRSKVTCLTVRGLFSDFGGKGFTPSFRGDAKHRARNLEIPGLVLTHHPGMTSTCHHVAVPRMVGSPLALAVHRSSPVET